MRVLVTGARGFTGRYVADELQRAGHQIVPLAANLRDAQAVRGEVAEARADAVIHLAGVAFVAHGQVRDFYDVNLIGTMHLLEALATLDHAPTRVLLAGTATIYATGGGKPLGEAAPLAPASHYAVSKLAMERMAALYGDRLPLVIVRPFNYTGQGQRPDFLVAKIVDAFRRGQPAIELGNLDVRRDFGDVRAVAKAYAGLVDRAVEPGPTGNGTVGDGPPVFNVCNGMTFSPREILETCERIAGHRIDVTVNPAFVREGEAEVVVGDHSRLRAALPDWRPIPFQETLAWMLDDSDPTGRVGNQTEGNAQ